MNSVSPLPSSTSFRLGTLGAVATARFTARIAALGLKPKDVGLLTLLRAGGPLSQLEAAKAMGVAPSLVVTVADRLELLGAVRRLRDPGDRRRQQLTLTQQGQALLDRCAGAAHELDAEFTAELDEPERTALDRTLAKLAAAHGLPA
ncbi:MarR family transcriptional regulator [Streptomyces tateyamensis]|uniref:MarR family transcriptional regulator n=1 Tax=Streptomyces tateyamensis TaxID=565073 RepID=A0A2V4MZ21_9ACTN|nr:MarR family transcriptional regulator [Streptomyces tateyamensis]PYC69794.1 MarR family transcriptional regulator [Streptomyces tateyamensis]